MVQFQFKLAAVLLLWKNNIVDFTVNVQEISDPGHPEDCMLVTDNNDDGCEVEHTAKGVARTTIVMSHLIEITPRSLESATTYKRSKMTNF
jgi:hypothetical protein